MKNPRGFTLIETLLAVTLFMIVMVSAYSVFHMGIQIWKRVTGALPVQRLALTALERMGEDIRSIQPIQPAPKGVVIVQKKHDFKFQGSGESFLMSAILPVQDSSGADSFQAGGLGYAFKSSAGELCRMTQNASQLYAGEEPSCRVMLSGIQKLHFQYWIENPITKSFSWYDAWDTSESLPQAFRVEMEIKVKSRKNAEPLRFERTFWVPSGDQAMTVDSGAA